MADNVPTYLASAQPNPMSKRAAWFKTIAQAYAGIFLWIAFFSDFAKNGALDMGGIATCVIGMVVAGLVSVAFFYYVPGVLGMKTGLPLYVVGSSTFGTKGGIAIPGFFMGLLQIGWYSVATYFAAKLVLEGLAVVDTDIPKHATSILEKDGKFDVVFVVVTVVWGYLFAFLGAKGLKYVAAVSTFFPLAIIALLLIGVFSASGTIAEAKPAADAKLPAFFIVMNMFIGFFATAGAAGADFCTAARNKKDVWMGGLVGVALVGAFAGILSILTVAGAAGKNPELIRADYGTALETVSTKLGPYLKIILAIGSVAPACFCSFIIGNSLSTMLGKPNSRVPITLAGVTIGIVLAATGAASNLGAFFALIGASFGPVLGAMLADYLLSGCKWAGPRKGISVPGYAAWFIGFLVGISNNGMITKLLGTELLPGWHPAPIYSFVVGFIVYAVLAKIGLQGEVVEVENLKMPAEGDTAAAPTE